MTQAAAFNIHGQWFAEGQSQTQAAILRVYPDDKVQVISLTGEVLASTDRQSISVPARLGNTPRHLYFATGQKFESRDNAQLDAWMNQHSGRLSTNLIYQLESHWRLVLLSVVVLAAFVWGCIQYGIPLLSKQIAKVLPPSVAEYTSEQTLEILDEVYFEHTLLFPKQQQRLQQLFSERLNSQSQYRLLFRSSELIGANAMALPDGTIIMTDDLIRLAEHDEELLAVLAHEVGHVEYKHGLRSLVQNSLLVFMLMALTGDSSGVAEVFVGLPLLLVESAYSRNFEREADRYARTFLQSEQIALGRFPAILDRIVLSDQCLFYQQAHNADAEQNQFDCRSAEGLKEFKQSDKARQTVDTEKSWLRYFDTHPHYDERSALFEDK